MPLGLMYVLRLLYIISHTNIAMSSVSILKSYIRDIQAW
jgi:hypothetical protein